jgi:hypothetical protein
VGTETPMLQQMLSGDNAETSKTNSSKNTKKQSKGVGVKVKFCRVISPTFKKNFPELLGGKRK